MGKTQPTVAEWRASLFARVGSLEAKLDAILATLSDLAAGVGGQAAVLKTVARDAAEIPRLAAAVSDMELRMGELEEIIPDGVDPYVRFEEGARPSEFNAIAENLQLRGALEFEDAETFLRRRGFEITKQSRTGAALAECAWQVKNIRLVDP